MTVPANEEYMTYSEDDELMQELVRLHTEENLSGTECAKRLKISPATAIRLLRGIGVYEDRSGGSR
jgi:DNA-binding transcriptional regulator LsrR (DeoR family)